MRINSKMKVREVAGEHIVLMPGEGGSDMTRVVALNESALFLYNALSDRDFEAADVVAALLDEYEVDEASARRDAEAWIVDMRDNSLIVD